MLSGYVHIRSLQCVKITCKFAERFLKYRSFCRGTFFLAAPCTVILIIYYEKSCNCAQYTFISINTVKSIFRASSSISRQNEKSRIHRSSNRTEVACNNSQLTRMQQCLKILTAFNFDITSVITSYCVPQ